ncbi:hypothetical protein GF318_03210 [Candidatus Micrarchaeota archaeon]|nr:hypothetical protein [Candidatus Micrarchaeota archaeon]
MAGKKSSKKSEKSPKKHKPEKIEISNRAKRIWLKVRKTWDMSLPAFTNTLSLLSEEEAEILYGIVKHSLYKDSYVEMLREHPELREIVKTDNDRLCMHDTYEVLSFRLNKFEDFPDFRKTQIKMKGGIGREAPVFE